MTKAEREAREAARRRARDADEAARSVAFMKEGDDWPRWTLLPLKRPSGIPGAVPDLGFLLNGHGPVVYRGSIFSLTNGVEAKTFSREMYGSFEQLVATGWRVD